MIKITLGWLTACAILAGIAYSAHPASAYSCTSTRYGNQTYTNCYP